jgi:hypothetical protein
LTSGFEFYLRTGRRIASAHTALETKFNPWHDPEDGRFTFAGQGRYFPGPARSQTRKDGRGFGGGGGSFGGGGAGGSWTPRASPFRRQRGSGGGRGGATRSSESKPARQSPPSPAAPTSSRLAAPRTAQQRRPTQEPRLTIRKNGHDFSIDAHARTRRVSGEIGLQPQLRSRRAQSNAGRPDRRNTDDGGHYVAARFNGLRDWFNHFAQDANFNRGAYRTIEDEWAKAVRAGKRVFVDIVPHYRGTSMRPYKLDVVWFVDGDRFFRAFPNERQGK